MLLEPNYIEVISQELNLTQNQVKITLEMIANWDSVPFIARYRTEVTQNLLENQIREIIDLEKKLKNLFEAKQTAINWITQAEKMTPDLMTNLINAKTLKEVEDIYKPYKSAKKTKAMIAIENGFWVVAEMIKQNSKIDIPQSLLKDFSLEDIVEWAKEIIAAEISANTILRWLLMDEYKKYWIIQSKKKSDKMLEKLNIKDKQQIPKFELYFENELKISYIKPYQILAINRWEKLWILNVKILKDDIIFDKIKYRYANLLEVSLPFIQELELSFKVGYDALFSSVENEIRADLKELWEDDSIKVFQTNLQNLLMSCPRYSKIILAIDPWFRAWCKLAVLDKLWNPLYFDKIFLHDLDKSKLKLKDIISKYNIDIVVIWNWTATDEVQEVVKEVFEKDIYIVNESWASVYSAWEIAKEEFPEVDILDRWTISIWRRFIDPLSELVKVPVWSIWVGMYQHDINEKKLEEKLWNVVETSVNEVWINVNLASVYLLSYISWIDKRQAKKIYQNRPYKSRKDLKKVLSSKAFEQAIWFLRVPDSSEKLDNTDIHPEQYILAKYIIENDIKKVDLKAKELYEYVNNDTIEFIKDAYKNMWVEKRTISTHKKASKSISIEDIKVWSILDWVIRNVVAFWAFVDIWLKNDWLVHVSQITDAFVKDPNEFVAVWDKVKVKVTSIDLEKQKLQLSMKDV